MNILKYNLSYLYSVAWLHVAMWKNSQLFKYMGVYFLQQEVRRFFKFLTVVPSQH